MKKLTVFAAVFVAMSMIVSCNSSSENKDASGETEVTEEVVTETVEATTDATEADDAVIQLKDDAQFRPETKVDAITVLDFNAKWCGPCKRLTPAFHQVANEMKDVKFYNVDVDTLPETAKAFKAESIPMLTIITPDGTTKTYVGLSDFTGGDNEAGTEVLVANLKAAIEALKK